MARKLKFYGGVDFIRPWIGQSRVVIADFSKQAMCERLEINSGHLRDFFGETGNATELSDAERYLKGEPGLLVYTLDHPRTLIAYGTDRSHLTRMSKDDL
jgi:hypothetical protein